MKKLFFFRSSSSNANSIPDPPSPSDNEKMYLEKPWESAVEGQRTDQVAECSENHKDLFSRLGKQYKESQDSASFGLRRSLSSPISILGERNFNDLSAPSRSPSTSSNFAPHLADYRTLCHSPTLEKQPKSKRKQAATQKIHAIEKLDSSNSPRSYFDSSGNSPCSSPVPLRCREARLPQVSNAVLDLYIDGEQQDRNPRPENDFKRNCPNVGKDGIFLENRKVRGSKRPPRVQSTAPNSPTKEKVRSYSFRESSDSHFYASGWTRDDGTLAFPDKFSKSSVVTRLPCEFHQKSPTKSCDFDTETTIKVEDIYEDCSDKHPNMNTNVVSRKSYSSDNISSCHLSDGSYEKANGFCMNEIPFSWKTSHFLGDGPVSIEHEQDVDVELWRKGKEAQERVQALAEDLEKLKLQEDFSIPTLIHTIEKLLHDKRSLAIEVSNQIQSRIAGRSFTIEALRRAKLDLDVRTRRLEREKNELQSSLEKELDRRSTDWSLKLEKYQNEEQRLRDRVRELAEQNVSFQKEVSSFASKEAETRSRLTHLQVKLEETTEGMDEAMLKNDKLQQALSELQDHSKGAEADRDCIRGSYKEKENENKQLHKAVARLQRICGEQEKTINGLRQMLNDGIGNQSPMENTMIKLQMEQARLTGVEQTLRKELESCRLEVESLRRENINLLERLQGLQNGEEISSIKLDQALGARINCLQNLVHSLTDEYVQFYSKLLDLIKANTCHSPDASGTGWQEVNKVLDGYSVLECDMKFQGLKRGAENLRRSLRLISAVVQERSELDAFKSLSQNANTVSSGLLKGLHSEGELEMELKAEILLTRVLREKLCFKELELEQLQSELATSVWGHDILRTENQRAQDTISRLTHKMKDLELQMMRKDDNISQTQSDLQVCVKELTSTRGILEKITQERDLMWEEVKQYSENNMLLNCEVSSLRKRMEALEEDVLLKEGQISILKDSLETKPFNILYGPKSTKEFSLDC